MRTDVIVCDRGLQVQRSLADVLTDRDIVLMLLSFVPLLSSRPLGKIVLSYSWPHFPSVNILQSEKPAVALPGRRKSKRIW